MTKLPTNHFHRALLPPCILLLNAALFFSPTAAGANVACCNSIVPELPPATAYGSTIARSDNAREIYSPYITVVPDAKASEPELRARITDLELQYGPYALELVPYLSELGVAYFGDQDFGESVSSYIRAIHLLRINQGLSTPAQIPLLEQLIEAKLQLGEVVEADRQQEYLFRIYRKSLPAAASELLSAVENFADWQRAAYLAELDKERYARLLDLLDLYSDMSDAVTSEVGAYSPAVLPYLEGKMRAHYLLSIYPGETEQGLRAEVHQRDDIKLPNLKKLRFYRYRDFNFRYGEQTLQRMLAIVRNSTPDDVQQCADLEVALGDWYQWHHRYARALQTYRSAWEMMAGEAGAPAWRAATFSEPVELPTQTVFHPGRLPLRLQNQAQVVASFTVSRHGKARDIQVLSPLPKENQAAIIRGVQYLRDMRFRPRIENGLAVNADDVERSYAIRY